MLLGDVMWSGESKRFVVENSDTEPASPVDGMLWYDTSTRKIRVYSSGMWYPLEFNLPYVFVASSGSKYPNSADYVCDGTDDQVEIQQAIDSLTNGGTVFLLDGTFNITSSIKVNNSNVNIVGTGYNTVLDGSSLPIPDMNAIINVGDVSVTSNVTISNIRFNNHDTHIHVYPDGSKVTISDCYFNKASSGFVTNLVARGQYVYIYKNTFLSQGGISTIDSSVIKDNVYYNMMTHYVGNNCFVSGDNYYAMAIINIGSGSIVSGVNGYNRAMVNISGSNSEVSNSLLSSVTIASDSATVSGNKIASSIYTSGTTTNSNIIGNKCATIVLTGNYNVISNNVVSTPSNAVALSVTGTANVIVGNYVESPTTMDTIRIIGGSNSNISSNSVSNNLGANFGSAIGIYSSGSYPSPNGIVIANNNIRRGYNGIVTDSNVDYVIIKNNTIRVTGTPINAPGTNNIIADNLVLP